MSSNSLKEALQQYREAHPPSLESYNRTYQPVRTVQIHLWNGEHWVLPWAHLVSACHQGTGESGQLVLMFAHHEVVLQGIPGLKIRLPAIKLRLGGGDAYMFAISPEYLLKISYVSHRSKGKGSDIDTYQRMMKRSRLRKIHEFIEEKGTFPTNIVVNVDTNRLQFYKTKQEGEGSGDTESGVLGWPRACARVPTRACVPRRAGLTKRQERKLASRLFLSEIPPCFSDKLKWQNHRKLSKCQ